MALFGKKKMTAAVSDPIAAALVPKVALTLGAAGVTMEQAVQQATELVAMASAESRASGGGHPPGYGDELLRRVSNRDPDVLTAYEQLHADGVTDDDIRWYWNLSDMEKRVIDKVADAVRMASFIHWMDATAEEHPDYRRDQLGAIAGERVRQVHPMFGDPSDDSVASGEDRPLWPELKDRIDRYTEAHFADLRALHNEVLKETSFNAWVRKKMRAGEL